MKLINLEIITPEKIVYSGAITQAVIPTTSGEITVLADHMPLVSVIATGVIEVKKEDGTSVIMSISGGFIEVLKDKFIILADSAERAEELDLKIIEEARKKAQDRKQNLRQADKVEFAAVNAQLAHELAREKAAQKWRKLKSN